MKFGKKLCKYMQLNEDSANMLINYKSLKKAIKEMQAGDKSETDREEKEIYFGHLLLSEIKRVDANFHQTISSLAQKKSAINPPSDEGKDVSSDDEQLDQSAKQLTNYAHLNTEAVRKIVKKFKKKVLEEPSPRIEAKLSNNVLAPDMKLSSPGSPSALDRIINRARERSYFSKAASTIRYRPRIDREASTALLPAQSTVDKNGGFTGGQTVSIRPSALAYTKVGISFSLLMVMIYQLSIDLGVNGEYDSLGQIESYAVFRSLGLLCLLGFFWTITRIIWKLSRVDEEEIIVCAWTETPAHTIEWWLSMFITFALTFVLYLSASHWSVGNKHLHIFPLVLLLLFSIVGLSPYRRFRFYNMAGLSIFECGLMLPGFHANPFRNTLGYLQRVFLSPFRSYSSITFVAMGAWPKLYSEHICEPSFTAVLVADVMTSLSPIFADLVFTSCYYGSSMFQLNFPSSRRNICWRSRFGIRGVVMVIPLWLRLAQCFRGYYDAGEIKSLLNAGKYSSSILVVALGAFLDKEKTTCHSFSFVRCHQYHVRHILGLRKGLGVYYFALCTNPVLRLLWTLVLVNFRFEEDSDFSQDGVARRVGKCQKGDKLTRSKQ
eukprot:jgi/Bigna1/79033/fgenesh1_pg.59_\